MPGTTIIWDATRVSSLDNGLGLLVVIGISLLIYRRHPTPFFSSWLRVYCANFVLWGAEFWTTFGGRSLAVDLFEFGLASFTAYQLCATVRELDKATLHTRLLIPLLVCLSVVATIARLAGVPYATSCLPPFLGYLTAYAWLGWVLVRGRLSEPAVSGAFVGWPILAFVAWLLFAYPAFQHQQIEWLAFMVSGILQTTIGCSMCMLLFERAGLLLKQKNQELEKADRWKDEVIGIVSHELRTPISAISSAVHLLTYNRGQQFDSREAEVLAMIDTNAAQLRHMIDDILDLARMQAGVLPYDAVPANLTTMLRQSVSAMAPAFELKGVSLALEGPEEVPILMDPGRLGQVLKNLVGNALTYTPPGGEVSVRFSADDDNATIVIEDTGIGISAEHLPNIFDKFYRVDNGTSRRSEGLGLGLSVTRAIVQNAGGTITVASVPSQGSVFTVRLPLDGPVVAKQPALAR